MNDRDPYAEPGYIFSHREGYTGSVDCALCHDTGYEPNHEYECVDPCSNPDCPYWTTKEDAQ